MFKLNKKSESGRSMVEMLGVLAIIGVLSIGGIAGYTIAMNSYRANEAINRVMRLAILVSSQKQLGQTASLSSEDADVTLTQEDGKFTLTLSGLSPSVRTKIASMDLGTALFSIDAQGNLVFAFNNDLTKPNCTEQSCMAKESCVSGSYKCTGMHVFLCSDEHWVEHRDCNSGCVDSAVHNTFEEACPGGGGGPQ